MKLNKIFSLVTKEDKIVMDALEHIRKSDILNRIEYIAITAELLTSNGKNNHIVKIKLFEGVSVFRELLVDVSYTHDYTYYIVYQEVMRNEQQRISGLFGRNQEKR